MTANEHETLITSFQSTPSVSAHLGDTDVRQSEHRQNRGYTDTDADTTIKLPVRTEGQFTMPVSKIKKVGLSHHSG